MQEMENPSLEQIRAFLDGNLEVRFKGEGREEIYAWVDRLLRQQDYARQSRADKGLLRRYGSAEFGLLQHGNACIGAFASKRGM